MSQPFNVVIPDDPTTGLTQYRAFLTYLKEHPDVPNTSKFELQLLLSMSRRLQTLQTTYAGLFQMEETEVPKLKSMRDYILIMLKKLAPNLSVTFTLMDDDKFTLATSGVMVVSAPPSSPVKSNLKAGSNTFQSDDTDLDSQLEKDMLEVANRMENDRTTKQDSYQTPVRHVHTKQSDSTTSSVTTRNSNYAATVTGKAPKTAPASVTPVTKTTLHDGTTDKHLNLATVQNPEHHNVKVPAQDNRVSEKNDQDSPIYAFEHGDVINLGTFSTNQTTQSQDGVHDIDAIGQDTTLNVESASTIPPGSGNATKVASSHASSDGFTLVTEGVKSQPTQFDTTKSVASNKTKNLFALLNSDDDDDNPVDQKQDSEETHLSPILLGPHQQPKSVVLNAIRDNIAMTPMPKTTTMDTAANTSTQKSTTQPISKTASPKKNKNPSIPGTFSLADKKFREKKDGFNAIEDHLRHDNHHLVSLNDLAWYITTAKPRIGHIRGQVRSECESVKNDVIRVCQANCSKTVDFATMKMSRTADAECNKLNTTSHNIFQELDKAKTVMTKMASLHDMCAAMVKSIGNNPHQFATRAEQSQTVQKCKDSMMDMANELTRVEAKLRVLHSDVLHLRENSQINKNPGIANDSARLQEQIDFLRQRMNQNEADLTKIRALTHGQNSTSIIIDKQEYDELKRDITDMRADIAALKEGRLPPITPAGGTPSRSKLFPNVDPTKIASTEIPSATRSSHFPPNVQPSTDPMTTCTPTEAREQPLPYGQRLIVNNSGCAIECWLRKCYQRIGYPHEYEAVTCGGDNIKFQRKDVIIDDFEPSQNAPVPHDYIVTIAGGYDATPEPTTHHAMKMDYPDDDDFSSSSHHSYHRHHNQQQNFRPNNRGRYQHLAHNAFIYPLGGVPKIIREEKATAAGKEFTGHLAAHEDPRNFYTQIRQTLLTYQVLLRAYVAITKTTGLLEINAYNCQNYDSAKLVMSRFLYIFFFHGRDTMFDNNNYARFSLVNYEEHQDGLSFLLNLIRECHPKLRSDVNRSSITKTLELPKFEDTITIWEYIAKCQIYIKDVQPSNCTQVDVLRIVQEQISKDPRFKTAAEHLQAKISILKNGDGSVPNEYTLKNLTQTIMECYELNDREHLSQPRRTNRIAIIDTPLEIQRVQRSRSSHQQSGTDRQDDNKRTTDKEKFCKSCITYGHTDEECTKTGAAISIEQYLKTCSSEKKRQILEAYKENRKAAHARYLAAYERRKDLKKKIRRIHYDYMVNPHSHNNPQAEQTFEMLRVACVKTAQAEHPDLDFGSIDAAYNDIEEPIIHFDPTVDALPHEHDSN